MTPNDLKLIQMTSVDLLDIETQLGSFQIILSHLSNEATKLAIL